MKNPTIYFISGVCGVGKTSTLKHLKELLSAEEYDLRDFDERGVPDGGGSEWQIKETLFWLETGAENAKNGKSTIVSGGAGPDRFKNIYKKDEHLPAQLILLDASRETIRRRLIGRYPTRESIDEMRRMTRVSLDKFVEDMVSFAPTLRKIFEISDYPIIDTDGLSSEEVAKEIIKII